MSVGYERAIEKSQDIEGSICSWQVNRDWKSDSKLLDHLALRNNCVFWYK